MGIQLIEDTKRLCKKGKVIIPTSLCQRAVKWYHHYLQHPGQLCLEETMWSVMFWKGMRTTIRRHVKSCRSCQVNKRHSQKYGHLPPKLVITTPWKTLCVDLVGPYTLKCRMPLINVPYKCTFGASDQGQMIDVWGGIQQMSTLRWQWHSYMEKSPPHPGMKSCTSKDITGGISAMILDHTDRN